MANRVSKQQSLFLILLWFGLQFRFIPGDLQAQQFQKLREINPPADPPDESVFAIVGGLLIDGLGGKPVEDSIVVVRGNKIEAAGNRATVALPAGIEQIDAHGMSVMPGLVDSHFHTATGDSINSIPPLFLSHGVTTARDPGRPIEVYAPYLDPGRLAPRLFLTGPHYDQPPMAWPDNAVAIESIEHAKRATRKYFEQGASAIKVYFRLPLAEIRATCEQAHGLGIPVTAHLELVDADLAVAAGLDGIEHITSFGTALAEPEIAERFRASVFAENAARSDGRYRLWATLDFANSPRKARLLKLLRDERVVVSPTLATFERRAGGKDIELFHVEGFEHMMEFVGECYRAGVTVVTGSHTWSPQVPMGWAYQREMELLLESGLSPMEVILASTSHNAKFLGCDDRLGTLAPGKLADIVVVNGNPLEDMKAMYQIAHVVQNGNRLEPGPTWDAQ
ncbi:MAG: amidohydrolase family protein [Planctomycetales bacterium]|nr:amidohydrolase family protein [Planctomycetales bacterium]